MRSRQAAVDEGQAATETTVPHGAEDRERQGTMDKHIRKFGWLMAAGLLGAALIAPSATFAIEGSNQKEGGISWDDPEFQGSAETCEGADLAPGEVLWHFVQTQPEASSGNLSGTIDPGGAFGPVASSDSPANVIHWYVKTGQVTLLTFESDVDGGNLVLSHICSNTTTTTTTTDTETTDTETTDTETTDTETTSTGTEEEKTPPETDSMTQGGPSSVSSALLLLFAGLLATALIVPAKARSRR